MKHRHSRAELMAQVTLLSSQGASARAISRALGISRNTVRKLLLKHHRDREVEAPDALPRRPPRAPRARKPDAYEAPIAKLLERYPDITAQRVFEELGGMGYSGGYTAVKEHVRQIRPSKPLEPSLPTPVYGPGEMAECDWSPMAINFTHAPKATVQIFGYALVHSTRKHFELYERSDLCALMDGHTRTFARPLA